MRREIAVLILAVTAAVPGWAQPNDAVRIGEDFAKDAQYHVACQVEIAGTLSVPQSKDGVAKPLKVSGKSSIKYDERILKLNAGRVERTVRNYRQLEFERKIGTEDQHSKLRPEAHRLVILRHNQYEVPFCPHGPLTWGEIELVRTDVFAPALAGLFPTTPVRVGARWKADNIAIQELTDLERIDKAEFVCTFEKITTLLGRRNAHVQFEGRVHGIGEDGNAMHELRGAYYLDLDAGFLGYLYVKGTHHLLDKSGNATGKIDGTFVMTRNRTPLGKELSDAALQGLTLEPGPENTMLLFEHPQIGARFLYPRNWRIAGFNDKQIGIDENKGSGTLLTLAPAADTPTGAQFYQETLQFLGKQKARILREEKPRAIGGGWEVFAFEAEVNKERVILQYYTTRQGALGATLTARILPADLARVQGDVERMARSLQLKAAK
ncbi:MAG: hypothetical protein HY289_02135 [Planctomycetes bacterium]|nr:hypothetical protein [Planctomycetota bacterium]